MAYPRTRYFPPSTLSGDSDFLPVLKFGDSGPEVEDLQGLLADNGFAAGKDSPGQFGSATLTALRAFQTAKQLPVTGSATAATWDALTSGGTGSVPGTGKKVTMGPLEIKGDTGLAVLGVLAAASALWIYIRMRSKRFTYSPAMAGLSRRRRARR